jgi:hypothetical protein
LKAYILAEKLDVPAPTFPPQRSAKRPAHSDSVLPDPQIGVSTVAP